MDQELFDITTRNLQTKFKLPKLIAKKIEEANYFINQPHQAIKNIIKSNSNTQSNSDFLPHRSKQKLIRVTTLQQQIKTPQTEIIQLKMKKFKPTNGSYSQFYGEQLFMNLNRSRNIQQKNKRQIDNSKISHRDKSKTKVNSLAHFLGPLTIQLKTRTSQVHETPYLQKILSIRQRSELLRQNSKFLNRKAQNIYEQTQNRFEKLKQKSNRMVSGEQKYILDEELSKTYRNNALQGSIRWKSKK